MVRKFDISVNDAIKFLLTVEGTRKKSHENKIIKKNYQTKGDENCNDGIINLHHRFGDFRNTIYFKKKKKKRRKLIFADEKIFCKCASENRFSQIAPRQNPIFRYSGSYLFIFLNGERRQVI